MAGPQKIVGLVQNQVSPFKMIFKPVANLAGDILDFSQATAATLLFHGKDETGAERIETWAASPGPVAIDPSTTSAQLVVVVTPLANLAGTPPTAESLGGRNENATLRIEVTVGGTVYPMPYVVGFVEAASPTPG